MSKKISDTPLLFYSIFESKTNANLKQLLHSFLFNLSPDVPYDFSKQIKKFNYKQTMINGFIVGFIVNAKPITP
ncbi:hypothetical protein [Marinibactrum halimedae]|uniref:Uncharacterized protein n=1 Tax=Marinibactrum halimedae TaxID=1444977 RepID=A0AA37T5B2_9GAMM|nr:hypothetical protein [Marinibactrum halimedae]MCD9459358.1 hypothetical protein [Marinibactrum halimedae]GLS27578.1 hypothetical protein GCM10007877_32970 [Marinibactrum halimedae]